MPVSWGKIAGHVFDAPFHVMEVAAGSIEYALKRVADSILPHRKDSKLPRMTVVSRAGSFQENSPDGDAARATLAGAPVADAAAGLG